ncbi:phosphoadenosine phosphosulfate reductase family protein [Rhodococcus sp. 3A]|nr:phosphoadenosine phosphosulfate reductase family protein [Rhodococcus sp. 3A]
MQLADLRPIVHRSPPQGLLEVNFRSSTGGYFSPVVDKPYRADPPLLTVLGRSGEWDHQQPTRVTSQKLRDILIGAPSRAAYAAHGPGEIWGVRADESSKRTGCWSLYDNALSSHVARDCDGCCTNTTEQRQHHGGVIDRADRTRVFGPVWDWSVEEIWAYIAHHQLPANPVYDKLRQPGTPDKHLPTRLRRLAGARRRTRPCPPPDSRIRLIASGYRGTAPRELVRVSLRLWTSAAHPATNRCRDCSECHCDAAQNRVITRRATHVSSHSSPSRRIAWTRSPSSGATGT